MGGLLTRLGSHAIPGPTATVLLDSRVASVVVGSIVGIVAAVLTGLVAAVVAAVASAPLVVDVLVPACIDPVLAVVVACAPACVELLLLLPPSVDGTAGVGSPYPPGVVVLVSARLGLSLLHLSNFCLLFFLPFLL